MTEITISLYASAAFILLVFLLILGKSSQINHFFVLVFFILMSIRFISEWLMLNPDLPLKALWLAITMATSLFIAPIVWLYSREITEASLPALSRLHPSHYLILILALGLLWPLASSAHWGNDWAADHIEDRLWAEEVFIVHACMLAAILIFAIQAPLYLIMTILNLRKRKFRSKHLFSNISDGALNTARALIVILSINWLLAITKTANIFTAPADRGLTPLFALVEVSAMCWAVYSVIKGKFLFSEKEKELGKTLEDNEKKQYAKSSITQAQRTRILNKLTQAFADPEFYTDNQLDLSTLCQQISEAPHYVSQVITQDLKTSFYDLINSHRVKIAKQLLVSKGQSTILEVLTESGFNSKSTFNTAFKKQTGMTPSQFRSQQLN